MYAVSVPTIDNFAGIDLVLFQIASFIRQLNLYKMQRMSQLALLEDLNDSGGRIEGELTHTGFSHANLQRGHPEMLHMIKRKRALTYQSSGSGDSDHFSVTRLALVKQLNLAANVLAKKSKSLYI